MKDSTYGFVLGFGGALPPCQNLITFCYIEICKVQPLFVTDVLDEIALGADRLFTVSEFIHILVLYQRRILAGTRSRVPGQAHLL